MKMNSISIIDELSYYRKRLKMLVTSDKGKRKYEDEADEVFAALFCVDNVVSDYLDAKNPKKANRVLDKIDRKAFTKIIGTNEYFKVVASLVAILIELDKKKGSKKSRKQLEKLYKKTLRALIDKVDIKKPTGGIDLRFLEDFNKAVDYDDDDDDYFDDDDIDYGWYDDDYGSGAISRADEMDNMSEYFSSSSSRGRRRYDDDDDDVDYESARVKKLTKMVKSHDRVLDEILTKLDSISDHMSRPVMAPAPAPTIQIPRSAPVAHETPVETIGSNEYNTVMNAISAMIDKNNKQTNDIAGILGNLSKRLDNIESFIEDIAAEDDDDDEEYEEDEDEEIDSTPQRSQPKVRPAADTRGNLTRLSQQNSNWVPQSEIFDKLADAGKR